MATHWKKMLVVGVLLLIGVLSQNAYATEKDIILDDGQVVHKVDDFDRYTDEEYLEQRELALRAGYSEETFIAEMNFPDTSVDDFTMENPFYILNSLSVSGVISVRQNIVTEAYRHIGKPYVWGGKGPNSFDCSGLVRYVFLQVTGVNIGDYTVPQESSGKQISVSEAQAGDLYFWGARGSTTHVAIATGSGSYINAANPTEGVKVGSITSGTYPSFAVRVLSTEQPSSSGQKSNEQYMYRMFNYRMSQHHYASSLGEANSLVNQCWYYEHGGWAAPTTGSNVYRLYNPNNSNHFYTTNSAEKDNLVRAGWRYEGVSLHSGGSLPIYRVYNPNARGNAETHLFTPNGNEKNSLVRAGWRDEGVAFYGIRVI